MPTLYYTDYSNPDLTQQLILSSFLKKDITTQKIPPKHDSIVFVDKNVILNESMAISYQICQDSALLGSCYEDQIEVYTWIQFYNRELHPVVQELSNQIFGKKDLDKTKFEYSHQQLKKILKVLDECLKIKTFFVGNSITLADIALTCQLERLFKLLIDESMRKKIPHLMRWFNFTRKVQPFVNQLGNMHLCTKSFIPNFEQQTQSEIKEQRSTEKMQQKQQKNKEQEPKFSIDDFKRQFQNSQNKDEIIKNLLNQFPQNFSIWKIYYNKDVNQGKVDYIFANLARGNIQKLQALRRTGFGNLGVYYSEQTQQYEIRGIMIWKGTQVAEAWKDMPSHEYHIFKKLDPQEKETYELVRDYWTKTEQAEGLTLYDSYKLI